MASESGGNSNDVETIELQAAIDNLIKGDFTLDSIIRIETEARKFAEQVESRKSIDKNIGLNKAQISILIESIVNRTNSEYSEGSLKRSLESGPARASVIFANNQIKISPTILGLKVGTSRRLIEALIPNSEISPKSAVRLCNWALGNRFHLNVTSVLLPVLKWLNCILHYELCSSKPFEALYELFLQSLDCKTLQTIILDILYKVTGLNKSLVTSFRIKRLLDLRSKCGEYPELENILKKYKMLMPHLITVRLSPPKISSYLEKPSKSKMEQTFEHCWGSRSPLKRIFAISKTTYCRMESSAFGKIALDQGDQIKTDLIPPAHYLENSYRSKGHLKESKKTKVEENIKLSDCRTLGDMFANIHQLTLPCQAMSLIGSPHLFNLIMLNPSATEMKERLSFTLYHTLHNEFFSQTSGKGDTKRKKKLLKQISELQERQQTGIPIVYRFLAEYISTRWNGSDFFLEILRLLAYLPITEFEELNDCLLQHIRIHFNNKFTSIEQLLVLTYLHKLLTHWCVVEYERCLVNTGRLNNSSIDKQQGKGEPEKGRAGASNSNQWRDWGFFTCGEKVTEENGETRYIGDDTYCENPLRPISDLTDLFGKWTELALSNFFRLDRANLVQNNYTNRNRKLHFLIFINEILLMYLTLCKCVINKGIPIRPSLPSSVIYMCIFSSSTHLISLASQFITTVKNEIIPLCKNKAKNVSRDEIAFEQLAEVGSLNAVTKDMIAVFANNNIAINRGESIFKQNWDIEHEDILKELSLISHPALLNHAIEFCKEFAENGDKDDLKTIYHKLYDSESAEFRSYEDYLERTIPGVSSFYKEYCKVDNSSHANKSHSTVSNTTSGISSMKTSKWNCITSNTSGIGSCKRPASTERLTRSKKSR